MNRIVGHDEVVGQKFPRFSGPCAGCGAVNYGLSTSGPDYCGSCACGTPPEVTRLRRKNDELFDKYMDASLAIGLLTGHFPPFNDRTRERATKFLAERKVEWEARATTNSGQTTQEEKL